MVQPGRVLAVRPVSIVCGPLAGGTTQSVPVVDTGSYTNSPQLATCPSPTGAVSFAIRGDCGVDKLTPRCAPLACK